MNSLQKWDAIESLCVAPLRHIDPETIHLKSHHVVIINITIRVLIEVRWEWLIGLHNIGELHRK